MVTHKYIYVIVGTPDTIKIGVATNVKSRLSGIQTGSPVKLKVFHTFKVPAERAFAIESVVHERLAKYELEGEWFRFCAAQAVVIISKILKADVASAARGKIYLDRSPQPLELRLVCPQCRHTAMTNLTKDEIWNRMFRCTACHASVDGRRFFVRIAI
jgi:hypothetical protein